MKIVLSLIIIIFLQGVQGLALQKNHEQRIPGLAYESFPQY